MCPIFFQYKKHKNSINLFISSWNSIITSLFQLITVNYHLFRLIAVIYRLLQLITVNSVACYQLPPITLLVTVYYGSMLLVTIYDIVVLFPFITLLDTINIIMVSNDKLLLIMVTFPLKYIFVFPLAINYLQNFISFYLL